MNISRNIFVLLVTLLVTAACTDRDIGKPGDTVHGVDRAKILDLLYRYTYAYDEKDVEAMKEVLTEDTEWIAYLNESDDPAFETHTRKNVLDWMANRVKIMEGYELVSHDLNLLPILTWVDEDTVQIKSTSLNLFRSGKKIPRPVQSGISESIVVRGADAKWRFSSRIMHLWGRFNPHEIGRILQSGEPFPKQETQP